mgnify:CR=1 FL=1
MTKIVTHPATPEYRDGWDRIFGKKDLTERSIEEALHEVDPAKPLAFQPTKITYLIPNQ